MGTSNVPIRIRLLRVSGFGGYRGAPTSAHAGGLRNSEASRMVAAS